MDQKYLKIICDELSIRSRQAEAAIGLLEEENTVPFIARYRKEMTGNLDEEQLRAIEKLLLLYRKLVQRKETVLKSIMEQGKLSEELADRIAACWDMTLLEDMYLPYKQKKRTRAMVAREKGLEPLAVEIRLGQSSEDLLSLAGKYIGEKVADAEEALSGASDILAETLSEDASIRGWVRHFTIENGILTVKAKDPDQGGDFEMYYDFGEKIQTLPSHRILAVNRGESKEILKVHIDVDTEHICENIFNRSFDRRHRFAEFLKTMVTDSYKRLIQASIEREIRRSLTEKAEEKAIEVFATNLYQLLMQPPVRDRVILGIDPAYRTGCKVAVIDATGRYLEGTTVYPTPPRSDTEAAEKTLISLIKRHSVEVIAIGNGTASRETAEFVADMLERNGLPQQYAVINEAGASVYSASPLAKEEFPELEASMRGNISIARRLMDPLSELVKIDPKSIGVGQYQHDVDQKELARTLDNTVEKAVNQVGVDVNTASEALLQHIAGMNKRLAKSLKEYISKKGALDSRAALMKVPGIGSKTYEQAAGFLKVYSSPNPLDRTAIHPESYAVTEKLFRKLKLQLKGDHRSELKYLYDSAALNISELAEELGTGTETLNDIIQALIRPDRDPREEMPPVLFKKGVLKLADLKVGTKVKGTIQNVTDFGAFMDIGLKNAGLIHISKLARRFVKNPHEIVKVGEIYEATVISIDPERERIGLSLID